MRTALATIAAGSMVFAVSSVGASMLDINQASDPPPASAKGADEATCAGELTIKNPVNRGGGDTHGTVTHVRVEGDTHLCAGQTLLVEVELLGIPGFTRAHALRLLTGEQVNTLNFAFKNGDTGDFYYGIPVANPDGSLSPGDTLAPPVKAENFGQVTLTVAKGWD
ncbi:MAG: hypothetical protein QG622_1495 [Actinomycetota bacterium]|nr:hypothetical protein [Actinomycetota bacterium]